MPSRSETSWDNSSEKSVEELTELTRAILKSRFTTLDYNYRLEDRKMTSRLDKNMLRRILKSGGLDVTPTEIDKLWTTFKVAPDGLFTWSRFCQQFTTRATSSPADLKINGLISSAKPSSRLGIHKSAGLTNDPALFRVREQISGRIDALGSLLSGHDPDRQRFILVSDAESLLPKFGLQVTHQDWAHVIRLFDVEGNGRFSYPAFIAAIKSTPNANTCSNLEPIVTEETKLQGELKSKWTEMQKAFKRSDSLGKGVLSVGEFFQNLTQLGIQVTESQKFDLVKNYDAQGQGMVNYKKFLASLS